MYPHTKKVSTTFLIHACHATDAFLFYQSSYTNQKCISRPQIYFPAHRHVYTCIHHSDCVLGSKLVTYTLYWTLSSLCRHDVSLDLGSLL